LLSENGINNLTSSHQKDNNFLITTSHSIDNFNNNNLNNLNSYAKSTTITSTNPSPPNLSPPSPNGHFQRQSPTSFEQQLRIFIPNYDDLLDNIRGQQPHSSRAGGSGMPTDRRNMMSDRRMNSSMMDRQMVRLNINQRHSIAHVDLHYRFHSRLEPLRFVIIGSP
jgi:hypothetical protein